MFTRYVLPLVAVIAFGFAILQMTKAQQKAPPVLPPTEPARSPFPNAVAGAGIAEPETENISIGTHLAGIVTAVHVRVDDRVKAGANLFELDDRALKAEREVRRANLLSAKAQQDKVLLVRREEELPPYRAKVAETQANLEDKQILFDRVRNLTAGISDEDVQSRKMAVLIANRQLEKAVADLKLMEAPIWGPDRAIAAATVMQSQNLFEQTEIELGRLRVTAPRVRKPSAPRATGPIPDGDLVEFKVLQVNIRPGEFVATSQGQALIVLGAIGKLNVRVDIDENDIGRFRPGIPGSASPRGNPGKSFPLKFVRVEPYVIPKKSLTGGNTERVDTRVLQVIYSIDLAEPGLYVGQQLDVSLDCAGQ